MRSFFVGCVLVMVGAQGLAAQSAPATPKLFVPAAELSAMIAKARAERKPDQSSFAQPILQSAPYTATLEYRVGGLPSNASVHANDAEMFYVIEGAGTMVTGGRIRADRTGIDDGVSQKLAPVDWIMMPQGVPHWFSPDGTLVFMAIHLQIPAK